MSNTMKSLINAWNETTVMNNRFEREVKNPRMCWTSITKTDGKYFFINNDSMMLVSDTLNPFTSSETYILTADSTYYTLKK